MYIGELRTRLIEFAQQKVRAGLVSERGLAKLCGMSQPHLHNALKNIRTLSIESTDRLMRALDLSIADLFWSASGERSLDVKGVPLIRNRIGPGSEANLKVFRGLFPFSSALLSGLMNPVAARLAPDFGLPRMLAANDLVLLDQNPVVRSKMRGGGVWVVAEESGLRIRYLRQGGTLLYIADETTLETPKNWHPVSLRGGSVLDIVSARVVWMGRDLEDSADQSRPVAPSSS